MAPLSQELPGSRAQLTPALLSGRYWQESLQLGSIQLLTLLIQSNWSATLLQGSTTFEIRRNSHRIGLVLFLSLLTFTTGGQINGQKGAVLTSSILDSNCNSFWTHATCYVITAYIKGSTFPISQSPKWV